MKQILTLCIVFLLSLTNTLKAQVDSLEFENLKVKVGYLTDISKDFHYNKDVLHTIDSLNNSLMLYQAKEGFYSSSLSQQSSRFGWILTGILAIFGAITLGGVNWQIRRLKEDNNKFADKMNEEMIRAKNALLIQEFNISTTTADVYTVQANLFNSTNDFGSQYYSLITVAVSRVRALKIGSAIAPNLRDEMLDVEQVFKNLRNTLETIIYLNEIISKSSPKDYDDINTIQDKEQNIRLLISEIVSFAKNDLQLQASKVLVGFENILRLKKEEK